MPDAVRPARSPTLAARRRPVTGAEFSALPTHNAALLHPPIVTITFGVPRTLGPRLRLSYARAMKRHAWQAKTRATGASC